MKMCDLFVLFPNDLDLVTLSNKVLVFHVVRGPFVEEFYQCVTYGLYSPAWLEKLYAVFSLVCMFVLPLLILLLTYISTFITLHKSEKVFRSERTTLGNTCPEFNRRRLLRKAKMRALRISVVIVLAFVICWTPYYMMMIIFLFTTVEENVAAELQSGIFFFGMSNSLVNPIIYGAFHLCRCHKRRTSFNLIVINRTGSNLQYRASTRASSRFTTYRSSGADLDTSVVNVFEDGVSLGLLGEVCVCVCVCVWLANNNVPSFVIELHLHSGGNINIPIVSRHVFCGALEKCVGG
ncbi:gonadotropin-releasing hormone receptor-like [Eriocheir sinensis]|uniref:gonadotropin-releasing hormone receptor-like n=1 Tax=Eriocheir sinensis TaxID=95602 RepID=UPI0021C59162|nr:gonadotropin-releasing hormone receptor-like [Eriocheir sinensis]